MTFVGGALVPSRVTSQKTKQITLTLANTEYAHTFPTNTKKFTLWTNEACTLKYATIVGDTGVSGEYVEISGGAGVFASDIEGTQTIYLRSDKANTIINLQSWS
jgi:hypothetical protein